MSQLAVNLCHLDCTLPLFLKHIADVHKCKEFKLKGDYIPLDQYLAIFLFVVELIVMENAINKVRGRTPLL
jgi:hypothetical protein